ncbi:MAG: T9SS type A sorting domain-containing protein [Ignavibacteriales bacterium]|nr:T9SS type A sorting domain-containing protein [Ignavibacteriales bacterium]
MKRIPLLLTAFWMACIITSSVVYAQLPRIVIEAMSPERLKDKGWTSNTSSGLKVVPKGTIVYLSAEDKAAGTISVVLWEMISKPTGSTATLDSTTTKFTTFRADTTGTYQIKLTITTGTGTGNITTSIYSQKFAGVGTVGGVPATIPQCAVCHSEKVTVWKTTGHATQFQRGIDGLLGSYSANCVRCHTTGYDVQPTATNNGFDDQKLTTGWTFPTVLQPGNFDTLVAHYPQLAQVATIGCENCHGPGDAHLGNTAKIGTSIDVGVCAQCHDALSKHPIVTQWENSAHSTPYYSNSFRQLPGTTNYMTNNFDNCVRCHDAQGFINLTDGLTTATDSLYRYNLNKKACTMCHEPHGDSPNEYHLRKITADTLRNGYVIPSNVGLGGLCMNCHKHRRVPNYIDVTRVSSTGFGPHPNNQTDMLLGKSGYDWGMQMPTSAGHPLVENSCVGCHMATPEFSTPTDSLAINHLGGHSWAMKYTDAQGNVHDNVGKCVDCHGAIESFDDIIATADYDENGEVTAFEEEIDGMESNLAKALPPYGLDSISWQMIRDSPDSLVMKRALYNLNFVKNGKPWHNPKYSVALLRTSTEMLHLLHTVGQIGSLKDVPNDQGKQIQAKWLKFPGETYPVNPIKFYGIWRFDEGAIAKTTIRVKSFAELSDHYSTLKNGTSVVVGTDVWTFVGWSPVSGMDLYSLIVPTLFDSTIVNGQHWTKYKVSGHAVDYTPVAWSNVDSGYSLDNLFPHSPGSFAATIAGSNVNLSWEQSPDPDVNFYQIFRDTVEFPNIGNRTPIATTTDLQFNDATVIWGKRYHYAVRGVDYSGNNGIAARTFIILLSASDGGGTPKEFALYPNYPNPFNPATTFSFAVPKAGLVTIDIYDLSGRLVTTLLNREMNVGVFNVEWNGTAESDQLVSSGMYIVRMRADEFVSTRKILLMK